MTSEVSRELIIILAGKKRSQMKHRFQSFKGFESFTFRRLDKTLSVSTEVSLFKSHNFETLKPSLSLFHPFQKLSERLSAMAVVGFLFRTQFRERFADRRKIKKRIVAKAIRSPWYVENYSFRIAFEHGERFAIASGGNPAHKPAGSFLWRHAPDLS
jgi:hypothetical protein